MLHITVLAQKVSPPPSAGSPGMAHSPTSPAISTSAASTESRVESDWESMVRFKNMPLGEKYEGRYKFTNVDQADMEISLLTGNVEGLEAVIKKYDSVLEDAVTRYRDAMYKCKSLHEDFKRLQEEVKVQSHLMEAAKKDSEKLEEKIAGYKERMGKFELQLGCAQEARQKVLSGKSHNRPICEGRPAVPREQGDVGGTSGRPSPSGSKMDNEMVQKVVGRMALTSKSGGMPPPPKAVKGGGKGPDPLIKFPADCTLVIEGIPYHTDECMYLPALVSCFGQWDVPNRKVVAVNIPRDANHVAGVGGTYVNRGHVFVRFSERRYMEEVRRMIDNYDQIVECDVKKKVQHKLRCRPADHDVGGKDFSKIGAPISERARYFDGALECFSMV